MVKRGGVLLVLGLVFSAGLLLLTLEVRKEEFGNLYRPQFITSTYLGYQRTLQVARPLQAAAPNNSCSGGTSVYGKYCVVSPYENEVRNASRIGNVTLCTQGTVEFLRHVAVLCYRWYAPVSVAVYTPPEDYADARVAVKLLRMCDACVRYWVNWHFFFPQEADLRKHEDTSRLVLQNCTFIAQMKSKKRRSQGIYPINVGRNVARRFAATPFVFSTDIELYPSLNIPAKFERMIQSRAPDSDKNQVWVLPVFEVHSKSRAPLLKSQLRNLYARKLAVSFHQYRCDTCHRIPNLTQWMSTEEKVSEVEESLEPLKIWTTVKRSRRYKLQDWEPFFIGTTKDPEFDIRLSWEGKQNKMQLAYEMCMRDYDFHIIENAFLVHTPGINVYNASKERDRVKYMAQNRRIINIVERNLTQKYGNKKDC